jgi:hypothetical protein
LIRLLPDAIGPHLHAFIFLGVIHISPSRVVEKLSCSRNIPVRFEVSQGPDAFFPPPVAPGANVIEGPLLQPFINGNAQNEPSSRRVVLLPFRSANALARDRQPKGVDSFYRGWHALHSFLGSLDQSLWISQ